MRRIVFLLVLPVFLSACSTLVPETTLNPVPAADARKNLDSAVKFADDAAAGLRSIQTETSQAQNFLTIASLGLATVTASKMIHGKAISSLRDPAIALGLISATDSTFAPRTKRQIVDAGLRAVSCAKSAAYTMNALPEALPGDGNKGKGTAGTNNSPMVSFAKPAAPSSTKSVRDFAASLRGTNVPAFAGAGLPSPQAALANAVEGAADKQDDALTKAKAQAAASQISAPAYLVDTVDSIVRSVIAELHDSDPSPQAITDGVQKQTSSALANVKKSVEGATDATKETAATVGAAKAAQVATNAFSVAVQKQADAAAAAAANQANLAVPPGEGFGQPVPSAAGAGGKKAPPPPVVRMAIPAPQAPQIEKAVAAADDKAATAEADTKDEKVHLLSVSELLNSAADCQKTK